MKKSVLTLATAIFFLFCAVSPLFAGGKQDSSLKEADELIVQKRYNRALELLSEYVKENPDNFAAAQEKIQKITKVRNEYNMVAGQLLDEAEKTDVDDARILELSNRLEELDPERIAETRDFMNRIRDVAQFRYNRSRLEKILTEAEGQIAAGQYREALATYAGGLDIYQDEFFRAGYGYDVESRIRGDIDGITAGITTFENYRAAMEAAVAGLESLRSADVSAQGFTSLNAAYTRLGAAIDGFTAYRSAYSGADGDFTRQLEVVRAADPVTGDRSFLAFALRLLEGRAEKEGDGMLGVIDTVFEAQADRANDLLAGKMSAAYAAAYNSALNGDYSGLPGRLDLLSSYASLPVDLVQRRSGFNPGAPKETVLENDVNAADAGEYAAYRANVAVVPRYRTISALGARYQLIQGTDTVAAWRAGGNPTTLVTQERNLAASIQQLQGEADALGQEIQADKNVYNPYSMAHYDAQVLQPFYDAESALRLLQNNIREQENRSLVREYTIANGVIQAQVDQREAEFARGAAMVEGSGPRSPTQAVGVFTALDTSTGQSIEAANALLADYAQEDVSDSEVAALYRQAQNMRDRLQTTQTQSRAYATNARNLSAQAQTYRQDGQRLFNEAQAALAQEDFERAHERLVSAGDRYDAALQIEDNADLRRQRDTVLPQLDAEISRLENEAVIRDVNNLLVSARTDYYKGDFDTAEEKLTRAQNRWNTTQTDKNQDIENWLNIIRSALSSRSGRTIPPTAPLYAEMSQLLSDARRNYDEGVYYYNQNRRTDGKARFDSAREKTQKVKLLYPLNEDAGLLELRMDRETDRTAFDENFSNRIQSAIAGTKRQDWQSYAELQNLFTINPNYPNRQALLRQAEIDMGIRPPPPDPAKIAASNRLTQQALAIVNANANNEIQLRQAQNLVNEALVNNAENEEAAQLLSRIAILLGGATQVFDSATEQKYQQAGVLLQQNRPLEAWQLAQEILSDQRYRNNSRLSDLLKRIQAQMQ